MLRTIEMMTIGKSPRWDVVRDIAAALDDTTALMQWGALDELADGKIALLTPQSDADALIAALGDGTTTRVSKTAIGALLQNHIDRSAEDIEAFAVLCTGIFSNIRADPRVVQVGEVLLDAVAHLGHQPCIGVLIPIGEQKELNECLWSAYADKVLSAVASPYDGGQEICTAARNLVNDGATIIVLSCMGYTAAIHVEVLAAVDCPVIAPLPVLIDTLKRRELT